MRKACTTLLNLLVAAVPLFSQSPQVNIHTGAPEDVLYKFFFMKVLLYEGQAGGRGPAEMRSAIRQKAGLTAPEAASLVSVAADWKAKNSAIGASIHDLNVAGVPASDPQRAALGAQSQQNVSDHVKQLELSLGPARFYLLDLYIRRSMNIVGPGSSAIAAVTPQSQRRDK